MTTSTSTPAPATTKPSEPLPPERQVGWRRMRSPIAGIALLALGVAALGQSFGTVVAGRLAVQPALGLLLVLLLCVVGGAVLDTVGRFLWAGVVDRAEGRLRGDLVSAALQQPLPTLTDQAVGEILDRVDDDTHEVGSLLRMQLWGALRAAFGLVPMWVIAGLTWWPAWILFPVTAAGTVLVMRPLLGPIAERKVVEEAAWTDHAAALEEGVAGRDDVRTSLGQAFVIQRLAALSARVHELFNRVLRLERSLMLRAGLVLHALLAAVAITAVAMASGGRLGVAHVVTLFLVTSTFVGQINNVAHHLPDLQAGLGAVIRLRLMLAVPPEPEGGSSLPESGLDLRFNDLHFAYAEGAFALRDIDLAVPSGQTLALVGRTGSGKSTLASLVSRAVDPEPGTVLLGGVDVLDLDLHELRRHVGVVTQRTEIVAGTLLENITLFADLPREQVRGAIADLGLETWVDALPDGLDTLLGPGGTSLSAGEEQLLAFARLLVRDVQIVVLDEATARMDPLTEARVVAAADRLLSGRTGILVAHRLSTTARADLVAVLQEGTVIDAGPRPVLAARPGPFRELLTAAESETAEEPVEIVPGAVGATRRRTDVPERPEPESGPSLARGIWHALWVRPRWGALAVGMFLMSAVLGSLGAGTGFVWGRLVASLESGPANPVLMALLGVCILAGPVLLAEAIGRYPRWWVEVLLRVRMTVLVGQTAQRRLPTTPPGEVVGRALDSDRYARYADRWVDFVNGLVIALVTALLAGTWLAGLVLGAVMFGSALASAIGRPVAGRSAARSSEARARFGRALVSLFDSVRTIKLAGRTPEAHRKLRSIDSGRVRAAVFEHRVQAILDGLPGILVQLGAVAAWAALLGNVWGIATTLLVVNAVNGFDWFGRVAGAVVTEAPGTRAWQRVTSGLAGGVDLMTLPEGVDLETGAAPSAPMPPRSGLRTLELRDVSVVHDDGTVGVEDVDLTVERGELVLLLGQVGSGKSSLLRALAGLLDHRGSVSWNGLQVTDPELFLRPGQVAYVGQVPRVLSGTFADNVQLGFGRAFDQPVADARLSPDVETAGGPRALVGHRGVRLSGGQVQRLALARALAADAELLLADDVSSALDATTEIELWQALRARGVTVVGATSKRAALAQADRVVVFIDGRVAAQGPWAELRGEWAHLAS